jgi:hypothetical protein
MRAPHIPSREALRSEVDEIVACVRGKGEPTSSGSLGLEVVRLLSALSLSLAEDGKRVVLGQ